MATKAHPSASLYVGDIGTDVTEGILFDIFNRVGPVASIRVCRDTITRRSLGYAYVNFHSVVDAELALDTLNNQHIRGRPCRLMWSQRDPSIRKSGVGNIFIKNLDASIGHKELFDTFSAFGNILSCKVSTDEYGNSKGFGFIHFEGVDAANEAIKMVNDKMLANKKVFVGKFESKKERMKRKEASWTNVYFKDLDPTVTEQELAQQFSGYGKITSVVIMRKQDDCSKGFGFVNYESHAEATKAVEAMQGQVIGAKKIWCGAAQKKAERHSELRKKFQQIKMERLSRFLGVNLYIKNIEDEIGEDRLKNEFSAFGTIRSAKIMVDENGNSRGFGFICYTTPEESQTAINEMNNRILQGCSKPLYVALHEPKEMRRTKLAQRQASRKMRMNTNPPAPSLPYPQPTYYGNGSVPGYSYPPSQLRQRIPTQNTSILPNSYAVPLPGRSGQPARGGAPSSRGGRGGNVGGGGRKGQPFQGQIPPQQLQVVGIPPTALADPRYAQLMSFPVEQQKIHLGELLHPLVSKVNISLAGKITGMLLDSGWSLEELFSLVLDETKLILKIEEAKSVLEAAAL